MYYRQETELREGISLPRLKRHVRQARDEMRDSRLSIGLKDAMERLLQQALADIDTLAQRVAETRRLMGAMNERFSSEHGWNLPEPAEFPVAEYLIEVERIEAFRQRHFGAVSLITTEKWALTRRYFESVAVRLRSVYEQAARASDAWLGELMGPMLDRASQHEALLRTRLDSVQRALDAGGQLQLRIDQLTQDDERLGQQLQLLNAFELNIAELLDEAHEPALRVA